MRKTEPCRPEFTPSFTPRRLFYLLNGSNSDEQRYLFEHTHLSFTTLATQPTKLARQKGQWHLSQPQHAFTPRHNAFKYDNNIVPIVLHEQHHISRPYCSLPVSNTLLMEGGSPATMLCPFSEEEDGFCHQRTEGISRLAKKPSLSSLGPKSKALLKPIVRRLSSMPTLRRNLSILTAVPSPTTTDGEGADSGWDGDTEQDEDEKDEQGEDVTSVASPLSPVTDDGPNGPTTTTHGVARRIPSCLRHSNSSKSKSRARLRSIWVSTTVLLVLENHHRLAEAMRARNPKQTK